MFSKILNTKVMLASSVAVLATAGFIVLPSVKIPHIEWELQKLETAVFQGGAQSVEIQFTSSKNFNNVNVFITPRLSQFVV